MLERVRLFTGRLCRPAWRIGALLIEDHHQNKSGNDAGGPDENGYGETIHFFHGRYYTDYGVAAGISLISYDSLVVSTT